MLASVGSLSFDANQELFFRNACGPVSALLIYTGLAATSYSATAQEGTRPVSTHLEVRVTASGDGSHMSDAARELVAEWQAYLENPIRQPERLRGILAVASPAHVHRLADAEDLPVTSDPKSINGRLARYVFFDFAGMVDPNGLLRAVNAEPGIETTHVSYAFPLTPDPLLGTPWGFDPPESYQWGMHALELPDAWEWSVGNALVAVLDNGLDITHPDLAAFDSQGTYQNGNFIAGRAHDYSDGGSNVDEMEPYDLSPNCSANYVPEYAGHGTHVTGIIAETTGNGLGGAGACPQCKLYIAKVVKFICNEQNQVVISISPDDFISAGNGVMDNVGAQIANYSGGSSQLGECDSLAKTGVATPAYCDMLEKIKARDMIFVASSGNHRTDLQFPARDPRVVSAGGIDTQFNLWDEAPSEVCGGQPACNCPLGNTNLECGSNFTTSAHWNWRQELVAPAKSVLSTFYEAVPPAVWNPTLHCLDDDPSTPYDNLPGYGFCTGTSMSAPHVSGFFGILRSLNPLLHAGDPAGPVDSLRYIAASTTFENLGHPTPLWDPKMGYGRPDAYQAVRKILGTIGGVQGRNRITPLFGVFGTNAQDSAYTTAPQAMVAFALNGTSGYNTAIGEPVPGYTSFPHESGVDVLLPKAPMYIFSSQQPPVYGGPELLPLYRMARSRSFPVNCVPGTTGCNGANRDFTYAVSASEIEDYHDNGFGLEKLEGFIFEPCNSSITVCPVPGTEKLHRMYNPTIDDTALVLESQRVAYVADGYSISEVIGSAYPPGDNDEGVGDGFIDSYELTVGLDPNSVDTDCDGLSDGAEWPLASIATNTGNPAASDPLNGTCTHPVSVRTAGTTYPTGLLARNTGSTDASGVVVAITVGSVSMDLSASIMGPSCVPAPSVIGSGGFIGAQSRWTCDAGDIDASQTASWSVQTNCGIVSRGETPMVTATIELIHVDQPDMDPTDNRTESTFPCGEPVAS